MSADVRLSIRLHVLQRGLRDRNVDILRALSTEFHLSVQNSGSRKEFYGVSLNGPLYSPESWKL